MQIGPLPLPNVPAPSVTPQAITQALPQVHALAASPITQRAVAPPPKTESGNGTKSNKDKAKGGDQAATEKNRGKLVNTSA